MNSFQRGILDHQEAIHKRKDHKGLCEGVSKQYPEKDTLGTYDKTCVVCREERFIAKLSYKTLSLVCKDCFEDPK